MKLSKVFFDGIVKENPVLVQLVGMCSVLAISNTMLNSISMGMAVTIVLVGSNIVISLLRNFIPSKIRIPAFVVVIATFVTIIEMFMKAYAQPIYQSLGIFIPLIVVNCIILARAEAFAYKNGVLPSIVDGLGMGLGYTVAVLALSIVRELFGSGTLFAGTDFVINVFGDKFQPAGIFVAPPGAFIVLGLMIGIFNVLVRKKATN